MNDNFVVEETFIQELMVVKALNDITYDRNEFFKHGLKMDFIQENESFSKKNVLRGLHIQKEKPQGKLVRVLEGIIYDVAVDLRKESKTFGKWFGLELSSENSKMLYIPEGFAHGFLVISDYAKVSFKVSNEWIPESEIGISWNDKFLNIKWPLKGEPIISQKDNTYNEFAINLFL